MSFRITSQFPKNEPDPGNTPPDHHGTFEKSPTKPPPGLTARLSSLPQADRRQQKTTTMTSHPPAGTATRSKGSERPHHQSRISNPDWNPTVHLDRGNGHPTGNTDLLRGSNRVVLRSPAEHLTSDTGRPHSTTGGDVPFLSPRYKRTLHAAAPGLTTPRTGSSSCHVPGSRDSILQIIRDSTYPQSRKNEFEISTQ